MAYSAKGLQIIGIGGGIPETFPTAGTLRKVYSYVTNDALTTVLAASYFDGITADPLVEGDVIICSYDIDGQFSGCNILYVETGGGSPVVVPIGGSALGTATTGLNIGNSGVSNVGSTTGSLTYTLDAPAKGVRKLIMRRDAATTGPTAVISSTAAGATFDGTNATATFALGNGATGISLELLGLSSTRWLVVGMFPTSTHVLFS